LSERVQDARKRFDSRKETQEKRQLNVRSRIPFLSTTRFGSTEQQTTGSEKAPILDSFAELFIRLKSPSSLQDENPKKKTAANLESAH
jgi:hypothetical protein